MKPQILIAALGLLAGLPAMSQDDAGVPAPVSEDGATDRDVQRRADEFRTWMTEADQQTVMQEIEPKAKRLLEGLDFSTLSALQIETLLPLILTAGDRVDTVAERLESLRDGETLDGLIAISASATINVYMGRERPGLETARGIINHPRAKEAVRRGRVLSMFIALGSSEPISLRELSEPLVALSADLNGKTLDAERAMALTRYWNLVDNVLTPDEDETRAKVRQRVADALREILEAEKNQGVASGLKEQIAMVDGAFARGELQGHEAPEIEFLWTSDNEGPKKLSDLRGKVVIVDFWATWCGPCIQSFPNVAELVKHYNGYEVAVIGVTAPQGRHHGADGSVEVTGNDRDREYELMETFIEQKSVSWPIVFSDRSVWTEYGVRGIPHVVIIDAEGVVRHRELHPMSPKAEKTAMIDALLREAKLAFPGG